MRKAMVCTRGLAGLVALLVATLALTVFSSAASAQDTMRVRGVIERVDGDAGVVHITSLDTL